jgi:RNA polymerase-binding transcription factor DksA
VSPCTRFQYHQKRKADVACLEIIEWTTNDAWVQRERFWIGVYRENGTVLQNKTAGGEGLHGLTFSEEHKSKIRQAALARFQYPMERERQRLILNNGPHSETTKQKIRDAANKRYATGWRHKMTTEHREKIRQANLRRSPELLEQIRFAVLKRDNGHYRHSEATREKIRQARLRYINGAH